MQGQVRRDVIRTFHQFLPPNRNISPLWKSQRWAVTCVSPMNLLMFSDRKIMSPSWVTTAMKPSKAFRYRLSICWSASASDSFSEQTGKRERLNGLHECGVDTDVTGIDGYLPGMAHRHGVGLFWKITQPTISVSATCPNRGPVMSTQGQ